RSCGAWGEGRKEAVRGAGSRCRWNAAGPCITCCGACTAATTCRIICNCSMPAFTNSYMRNVGDEVDPAASRKGRWGRLEPYVAKVTSTVLRGGSGGNVAPLPDRRAAERGRSGAEAGG